MNVLFLTQEYPPETGWGGVGTQKYTNARAMARLGHNVHVLAAAVPPSPSYDYEQNGVQVHRVRRWKFQVPLVRRLWMNTLPWTKHQWEYMITVRAALAHLVNTHAIECIEGVEIWGEGLLYSFQRRAPIVIKLSGPLFMLRELNQRPHNLDAKCVERADRFWTERADQLTCSSNSLAQLVSAQYQIERSKIIIVPNPVDTERFFPLSNGDAQKPTVLFSGRLEVGKGVVALVEAVPEIVRAFPHARFVFVGADKNGMQRKLTESLERAGVAQHVEFAGHVTFEKIVSYYQSGTVCVVPSHYESFGNVALEAMACGKPVVASNTGGLTEIVRDGETGLLVPPQDPAALANAIKTVLANPPQAAVWGENGRRRVQTNFSSEVIAKRTLEVYAETSARWKHKRKIA